jgi:ornithine cyclodeaminase/alanine dehydrogenase-like protein (mu-crystallin family)
MTLFLRNEDIQDLLDPKEIVDVLKQSYLEFAQGKGVCSPRQDLQAAKNPLGHTYQLGTVAGVSEDYAMVRLKSDMTYRILLNGGAKKEKYCQAPGRYFGLLLVFSVATGELLAMIHDGLIQRLRVGADSAIGVDLMSKKFSKVLGIFGAGGMALSHVKTISSVRPIDKVVVYSPTESNRRQFAENLEEMGISAEAVSQPEHLYSSADIICACTNSIGEVIIGEHLRQGTHVTAIGGKLDQLGSDRVDRYLRLGTATHPFELGEQSHFEEECLSYGPGPHKSDSGGTSRYASISNDRRVMLSDLIKDPGLGRTTDEQITFSERGNVHGIQFCAVASYVYEKALKNNRGMVLPTDGFLQSVRN